MIIKYQLRKWIPENKLVKNVLSLNPVIELEKGKKHKDNKITDKNSYFFINELSIKSKDPTMIEFFDNHVDKIDWNMMLSQNPKGYILGIKYFDIIPSKDKVLLCRYVEAFDFVISNWEKIPHKYKWYYLCQNPKAIDFLEQNQENIDWYSLSINPAIYEYDYKKEARIRMNIIRMELMEKTWHPKRYIDWCL